MKISCKYGLGNFCCEEEPFCEHCGDLSPFDITWCNGETWWCLYCAMSIDDFKITEKFARKIINHWKEKYTKFLVEQLNTIEEEVKKLYGSLMD